MTLARLSLLAFFFSLAWGVGADGGEKLTVSAAVSLKEPLAEVVRASGDDIDLHLGGSAALVRQLLRGAPSDVFVSASPLEVARLVDEGLVTPGDICNVTANELVVVVVPGSPLPTDLAGLSDGMFARIAVANPRTAPLGRYTRQALVAAGLETSLQTRLIPAEHARQVIDYVVRGEVDAAIVYATDAQRFAGRIAIAFAIDSGLHDPVVYQAAALGERGRSFLELVCSEAGGAVFENHGFRAWSGRR